MGKLFVHAGSFCVCLSLIEYFNCVIFLPNISNIIFNDRHSCLKTEVVVSSFSAVAWSITEVSQTGAKEI